MQYTDAAIICIIYRLSAVCVYDHSMDSHPTSALYHGRVPPLKRGRGKRSVALALLDKPLNLQPLPRWILASSDPVFAGGAAVFALDQTIRAEPPWLGCWRMRQALQAATAIARLLRLNGEEADLRDADCLTRSTDDPGPAGKLYRMVRQLTAQPLHCAEETLTALAETIKGAAVSAEIMAFLNEDVAIARRLGWSQVLLLGSTVILEPSLRDTTGSRASADDPKVLASAALKAHAFAVTLSRRSEALRQVASALRTRDNGKGLAQILNDDCVAPWRMVDAKGLGSDRAARRFCETLKEQGVLRLLSNRPTFRIYGL